VNSFLKQLASQEDPIGQVRLILRQRGMKSVIKQLLCLIIYESRPDVTVEAGGIAFKSGNKILLKAAKSLYFLILKCEPLASSLD
jgi:glutamate-5-semialdehyde dehydrogenase